MTPKEADTPVSEEPKKLTPYQGVKRCYGIYKCQKCDRQWSSGSSWANTTQGCRDCGTKVYPHSQRKLLRRKRTATDDPSKAHAKDLCGKCKVLGFCCISLKNRGAREEEKYDYKIKTQDDNISSGKKKRSGRSKKKQANKVNGAETPANKI